MEAASSTFLTSHVAPRWGRMWIAVMMVLLASSVSGERPVSIGSRTQPPKSGSKQPRSGKFDVEGPDDPVKDAAVKDGTEDDSAARREADRHGLILTGGKASDYGFVNPRDPLDGFYFHDSEKASQLVEKEARKIDQEATNAEGKAKNVSAEINKYDEKLKDLLKSLRSLSRKQRRYANNVNAEYMDKEYGPDGRLQAFTDFDLKRVTPFGYDEKTEALETQADDDTFDDEVGGILAKAQKTANKAQKISKDTSALVNAEKAHKRKKSKNKQDKLKKGKKAVLGEKEGTDVKTETKTKTKDAADEGTAAPSAAP